MRLLQVETCTFWSVHPPSACLWCLILVVTILSLRSQLLELYCWSGCYFSGWSWEKLICSKVSPNSSPHANPQPGTWCRNFDTSQQCLKQKLGHMASSVELKELLSGLASNQQGLNFLCSQLLTCNGFICRPVGWLCGRGLPQDQETRNHHFYCHSLGDTTLYPQVGREGSFELLYAAFSPAFKMKIFSSYFPTSHMHYEMQLIDI